MKLKDLKNYFKNIHWNREELVIDFNPDGNLTASFAHRFEMEDRISIIYYWYDHLARNWAPNLVRAIEDSLNDYDFEAFSAIANQIKNENIAITLPDTACIYNDDANTILGDIYLNENTFHLIMEHEYEGG